jgi:tetratricopeptide (TPR) repeat protein
MHVYRLLRYDRPAAISCGLTRPSDHALVGRDAELLHLTSLLAERGAVVNVTGPPGVGKTALARGLVASFASRGVVAWHASYVPSTISPPLAQAASEAREREDARALGDQIRRTVSRPGAHLVVLDGFEGRGLSIEAALLEAIDAHDDARVLVTSRAPLGLPGSALMALSPLRTPGPDEPPAATDAVALYLACVRANGLDEPLAPDDLDAVAEITRRLGGLPLAIELVASQPSASDPRAVALSLAERLPRSHPPRGPRALEDALREAARWALAQLDREDLATLRRCALFLGSFAPAAVSPDAGAVDVLLRRALLQREDARRGEPPARVFVTDAVRACVLDDLRASGELPALARDHARTLAALAPAPPAERLFEADALAALLGYRDDLVAAIEGLAREPATEGLLTPLVAALDLLTADGYTRARELEAFTLALAGDGRAQTALLVGHAVRGRVRGLVRRGRHAEAEATLKAALASPAVRRASWVLPALRECEGGIYFISWRIPEAVAALEEACTLARRRGDRLHAARISWLCTLALATSGRLREATLRLHESAIDCAAYGDLRSLARIESSLGAIALEEGRLGAARAHYDRTIVMASESAVPRLVMTATGYRGITELAAGDTAAALGHLDDALAMAREQGHAREPGGAIFLAASAAACVDASGFEAAVARLGAAQGVLEGDPTLAVVTSLYGAYVELREARRLLELDDHEGARARWRAVLRRVEVARTATVHHGSRSTVRVLDASDDARIALQIVEGRLAAARAHFEAPAASPGEATPPTLRVGEGGAWFALGAEVVALAERSLLRKILWALCEEQMLRPQARVSPKALIAAAWGDQRLGPKVATNRLYVAVSELRRLGLRAVLQSDRSGYRLDARVVVSLR